MIIRRYAAKLAYELELHGPAADLGEMPARYSELLGGAVRVPWPQASWMADVDDGFYAACYLRAWALETHWRSALRERFGERWFSSPEAGRVAARRCGVTGSGSTRTSCWPRRSARSLTSGAWHGPSEASGAYSSLGKLTQMDGTSQFRS